MKRHFFLYGCLLAASLFSACSDEVERMEREQDSKYTIEITLPANARSGMTRADDNNNDYGGEWNVAGECTVDKGVILVYESDAESGTYTLKEKQDVTFEEKTHIGLTPQQRWTAQSNFTPEEGKYYRFYAYAYNHAAGNFSDNLAEELDVNGKELQNRRENMEAAKTASFTFKHYEPQQDYPIELFGGYLDAYSSTKTYSEGKAAEKSLIISGSDALEKEWCFCGELVRQTGRLEISLTDMPDNVVSASVVMEKYTDQAPVGWEENLEYYTPFEREEMVTVATKAVENHSVTLNCNMFPTEASYVYVRVENTDGGEMTYPVRCADKWLPLGPDAVVGPVVQDNKLSIIRNYWFVLSGTFDKLQSGNNLTIQMAWEDDYNADDAELTEQN